MKRSHLFSLLTLLTFPSAVLLLDAQTNASLPEEPPPEPALSETLQAAVLQLGDEDYITREGALEKIVTILSKQSIALVNHSDSPASLPPILEHEEGVIRWLQQVVTLLHDQQQAQLKIARSPGMLKVISGLFCTQPFQRVVAIHELARFDKLDIDWLLAPLIADKDRGVSLAAMEVAWDRKPTRAVVQALWDKAVEAGSHLHQRILPSEAKSPLVFRGKAVRQMSYFNDMFHPDTDADIATAVLIHSRAVAVQELASQFFIQCLAWIHDKGTDARGVIRLPVDNPYMANAYELAQQFKVREAIPLLYALAMATRASPIVEKDVKGMPVYLSNRTEAAALFLIMTDQPHDAFSQRDVPSLRLEDVWVTSDEHAEDEAVDRITAWWKQHAQKYVPS